MVKNMKFLWLPKHSALDVRVTIHRFLHLFRIMQYMEGRYKFGKRMKKAKKPESLVNEI